LKGPFVENAEVDDRRLIENCLPIEAISAEASQDMGGLCMRSEQRRWNP